MGQNNNPVDISFTRAWLTEGRARPDHAPEFMNFLKMGTIDKNLGSINPIYEPDPTRYGEFVEVGNFRDEEERPSTSFTGHYAHNVKSKLLELALKKCAMDFQLHIGLCEDPSDFNAFQKLIIFEDLLLESYSTEELGALEPGERGKVDETGEVSAKTLYEFMPLSFAARQPSLVTNELLDIVLCDSLSCGDCEDESDGASKFIAISKAAGGSPTTPADIVFTLDKGLTWLAHDIDTLPVADDPSGVACVGTYLVVVCQADEAQHYTLKANVKADTDPSFTRTAVGYVAAGGPNAIDSIGGKAFIVGQNGLIYITTDPTAGVTVIDEGVASTDNLNAVDALSTDFAVAVGENGTIITIDSDLASLLATPPVGAGVHIQAVAVKNEKEWFVGDDAGSVNYTLDGGATWTAKVLPDSTGITEITDIVFASSSVMYVSVTRSGKGEIYISVNGGNSFIRAPRSASNALPANDTINALAVSGDDVDFVIGVGLADDAADGFIVVGSD